MYFEFRFDTSITTFLSTVELLNQTVAILIKLNTTLGAELSEDEGICQ